MTSKPLLGELLVEKYDVSQGLVDKALQIQRTGKQQLGDILVSMNIISKDTLDKVIADQLDIPSARIADRHTPEVVKLLPRYLCWKYKVLPLRLQSNNILELAMANPSDNDAIADISHYTGKIIEPLWVNRGEVEKEIRQRVPIGIKDIFSPKASSMMTKIVVLLAVVFAIVVAYDTYNYLKTAREGTISVSEDFTWYRNHDIAIGVDKNGSYSLRGRGAFSEGSYNVSFSNINNLSSFIEARTNDLSDKQKTWLTWALDKAGKK
ncbi:hypothetical protein [Desulfosediminicola flagellatus]|uniref:GspE/PulE/PilB domain-containing protein n=1 Tax=Desulfosediminicola flagellatus TaxID=2569541 RepID=UPI0010AB88EB|nr:hypothetical protein [Desulfosediminicola flagellatus]